MNTPKLRFKEYKDSWESKKIKELAYITMGQSPNGESYTNDSRETILIQGNADIINEEVVPRVYTSSPTKMCEIGDIILSVRAPVGEIGISQYRACIGRGVCSIRTNNMFLYHFLSKMRDNKTWKRLSQGSTFESINGDDIKETQVNIPLNTEEQIKISNFFDTINKKVNLQKEKINLLKEQKKGYMQRIFSQELRFKDVNGKKFPKWESISLNNFASKITTKNKDLTVKNVISNSAKNGLISQKDFFDKEIANQENIDGYYVISNGDFVYNPRISSDAPYGPINIYKGLEDGVVSPLYMCFRVKDINKEYLLHYFKGSLWYKYVYMFGDSGARHDRVSIKDSTLLRMPILVPSSPEQDLIANFLSTLQDKIDVEEKKLTLLQKQKQAFMQQMFI